MFLKFFEDRVPKRTGSKKAKPLSLSPYPLIERDFSFVVDEALPAERVLKALEKLNLAPVLQTSVSLLQISLFDVFVDERLGGSKKSLAIQVRLQPLERTLTEEDISLISAEILSLVEKQTGGVLRQL